MGFVPAGGNLEVVFSAIPPGTYRLYATNHLKLKDSLPFGSGAHLGVSMVSEGAMFEVFDTVLA